MKYYLSHHANKQGNLTLNFKILPSELNALVEDFSGPDGYKSMSEIITKIPNNIIFIKIRNAATDAANLAKLWRSWNIPTVDYNGNIIPQGLRIREKFI